MEKHIPLRMCIACRKMYDQNALIRLVKNEDGISLDLNKKKFGRGAYICRNADCLKKAGKKNLLAKHFKSNTDKAIYDDVRNIIENDRTAD